MENQSDNLTNA